MQVSFLLLPKEILALMKGERVQLAKGKNEIEKVPVLLDANEFELTYDGGWYGIKLHKAISKK